MYSITDEEYLKKGGIRLKKKLLMALILILSVSVGYAIKSKISVEKINKELERKITLLEKYNQKLDVENKHLQTNLESMKFELKPRDLIYTDNKEIYRLTDKEIKTYQVPGKDSSVIGIIPEKTIVEVEDTVYAGNNNEEWIYVELPSCVNGIPVNVKVWIRRDETIEVTNKNHLEVLHGVLINSNTPVYKVKEFEEIKSSKPEALDDYFNGSIEKRINGFTKIWYDNGLVFWVEDKYILYPLDKNFHLKYRYTSEGGGL